MATTRTLYWVKAENEAELMGPFLSEIDAQLAVAHLDGWKQIVWHDCEVVPFNAEEAAK